MTDTCKGCDVSDARICVSCKRKAAAQKPVMSTKELVDKLVDKIQGVAGIKEYPRPIPPTIKFKKLHPEATIPSRATDGSAGFDLTATSWTLKFGHEYGTGIATAIPQGYVGLLFMRSSVSTKDISLANAVGVIDSDYRGEIKLRFREVGRSEMFFERYEIGDRIGQLVVVPCLTQAEEVDNLDETERGAGGFGSTNK